MRSTDKMGEKTGTVRLSAAMRQPEKKLATTDKQQQAREEIVLADAVDVRG